MSIQTRGVKETILKLGGGLVRKPAARALNRSTPVKAFTDPIRSVYTAKPARLRREIKKSYKARPERLAVGVKMGGRRIPLESFDRRVSSAKKRPGVPSVRVRVRKGGGMKPIEGAFRATMRSGHVGIYRRASHDRAVRVRRVGPGYSELPIDEKFGPTVKKMFDSPKVRRRASVEIMRRFDKEFKHELDRELSRRGFKK